MDRQPVPSEEEGLRLAADHEFIQHGLWELQELYDLEFAEVHGMVIGLTHEALKAQDVDVALGYTTDGKIKEMDLVCLEDDKGFFGTNHPAPVLREEVLQVYPEVEDILESISAQLDTDSLIQLNYQVDIEEMLPQEAAENWLLEQGLLDGEPQEPRESQPVAIGSKEFVEQRILGQITLCALRHAGIPVEDHTDLGGTQVNRMGLIKGKIHMYWEYTLKAWHDIHHQVEPGGDGDEVYQQVRALDQPLGLLWLNYAPANSSMGLIMRAQDAEKREIRTISDLAQYAP